MVRIVRGVVRQVGSVVKMVKGVVRQVSNVVRMVRGVVRQLVWLEWSGAWSDK